MGIEKRRFKRSKLSCQILYPTIIYKNDKRTFYDNGILFARDVSESGISLESNFFVPLESFVSFYLRVEDNLPFHALVKIRWNRIDNGKFLSGGEFIALKLEDIHILKNYISNHS